MFVLRGLRGRTTGGEFPMGRIHVSGIEGVYRDHGELHNGYIRLVEGPYMVTPLL